MMLRVFLLISVLTIAFDSRAQEYAGGPPAPARYDVRASAAFPQGIGVSASMRLLRALSIEAGVGVLPIAAEASAGFNIHVRPDYELDPAISVVGTYMLRRGDNVAFASLMYGYLGSRKTGLHLFGRAGISAMYTDRKLYPSPAAELGLAYGFR